jgi:predicted ATPase/DNA-binding SARP family transcriptional activator
MVAEVGLADNTGGKGCRVQLLGGLCLRSNGTAVNRFRTRKCTELLAYLARHLGNRSSREVLIEMLWPDCEPKAGRNRLSVALSHLRSHFEILGRDARRIVVSDNASAALDADLVDTDVHHFEALLGSAGAAGTGNGRADDLQHALDIYKGPFLPGLYSDWVLEERDRLHDAAARAARELTILREKHHEQDAAVSASLRALHLAPFDEASCRETIRLLAHGGQKHRAREVFERFSARLSRELEEEPSDELRRVAERACGSAQPCPPRRRDKPRVTPGERGCAGPHSPRPFPGHLPLCLTAFVGREKELAELTRIMRDKATRLLTVTGPGGSGKTRLAVEVLRQTASYDGRNCYFVPLSDITDATRIPDQVLASMHVPHAPTHSPMEQAITLLRARPTCLVLDNVEHLLHNGRTSPGSNAADIVRHLLEHVPTLRCLATSRCRLGLPGCVDYRLSPLPTPRANLRHAEAAVQCDSVRLFEDRARAAQPGFRITERNAGDVAMLCRRLAGLPLAIELAAARCLAMSPRRILAELECGHDVLQTRQHALPPRHRSLDHTIDWSYRLLSDPAKHFMAQLATFRGGWLLGTAEIVFGERRAGDYLEELLNASLVYADGTEEDRRFDMLQTVRDFVRRRTPQKRRTRHAQQHAEFFLQLSGSSANEEGPGERPSTAGEWGNISAALEHLVSHHPHAGLAAATRLVPYWESQALFAEGTHWLARALTQAPRAPRTLRATGQLALGRFLWYQGAWEAGLEAIDRSIDLLRSAGKTAQLASALGALGMLQMQRGSANEALAACREGHGLLSQTPAAPQPARLEMFASITAVQISFGLSDEALGLCEAFLAQSQKNDNPAACGVARCHLGLIEVMTGHPERAEGLLAKALADCRAAGIPWFESLCHYGLSLVALRANEYDLAHRRLVETEKLCRAHGSRFALLLVLDAFGKLALLRGRASEAVRIFAAVESHEERRRVCVPPAFRGLTHDMEGAVHAAGRSAARVKRTGRTLTLDGALERAMA